MGAVLNEKTLADVDCALRNVIGIVLQLYPLLACVISKIATRLRTRVSYLKL